jgi:hypothetical protein
MRRHVGARAAEQPGAADGPLRGQPLTRSVRCRIEIAPVWCLCSLWGNKRASCLAPPSSGVGRTGSTRCVGAQ